MAHRIRISEDADLVEEEGEPVSDTSGDLGVPESWMWEVVYLGTEEWDKLLLGRGGHGDNIGSAGLGERGRERGLPQLLVES